MYKVIKVNDINDKDWQNLCNVSKQWSPFFRKDMLECVGYTVDNYLVYKKNNAFMGIAIPRDIGDDKTSGYVKYEPYQGLLYRDSTDSYNAYHNNLDATSVLIEYLQNEYKYLQFSNSCYVNDLRALQWHNYNTPHRGVFKFHIRYTGIYDFSKFDDVIKNVSKGRKLDYRYSTERYDIKINKCNDIEKFMDLYDKTFLRQGISVDRCDLDCVERIINLAIKEEIGEMNFALDKFGNEIAAIFILEEKGNAYYLFGANGPEARKYGASTLLLLEKMKELKRKEVKSFDFVGVNSPYRGDFKLSFGAEIKQYFVCEAIFNY